jgi:hypothetical protein
MLKQRVGEGGEGGKREKEKGGEQDERERLDVQI